MVSGGFWWLVVVDGGQRPHGKVYGNALAHVSIASALQWAATMIWWAATLRSNSPHLAFNVGWRLLVDHKHGAYQLAHE